MNRRQGLLLAGAFSIAALANTAIAADPAATKVLDCMRANIPTTVQIKNVEMTTRDRVGGERTLKAKFFGKSEAGKLRVTVRVEAPPDLARAGYLMRQGEKSDEMYTYLPGLNKVRRIVGASVDGSMWGSDISYNDIKLIQNSYNGGDVKMEGPQKVDGRDTQVMYFTPRKGETVRYTGVRSFVDQQSCVPLKLEFLEGATVRKRMTSAAKDLKQSGKFWYAQEVLMQDLKDNTQTRLKVVNVSEDAKISDSTFNATTFFQ